MMQYTCHFKGLNTFLDKKSLEAQYYLPLESTFLHLNPIIKDIKSIELLDTLCVECETETTIFANGSCKNCFFTSPQNGQWVIRPELSKAHLGEEDRDLEYEKKYQLQDHIVYLSYTDKPKVGVTRKNNEFTRWINQGAIAAKIIKITSNRYEAGMIESELKGEFNDKTTASKMVNTMKLDVDLFNSVYDQVTSKVEGFNDEFQIHEISYPIEDNIDFKILSKKELLQMKKISNFVGIKGNYVFLKDKRTFNVQNLKGYNLNIYL